MLEKTTAGWAAATVKIGLQDYVAAWSRWWVGPESYPERPDEPDCMYYLRTGCCGYGYRCRFNHPRDRSSSCESGKNEQRNVNGWDEDLMQYSKMDKWNIHNRSNLKRARRMDAMFKLRC
ncbi:hypothetical protein CASFOL_032638 [Castilleja foliolosa]|uniref:C3H1-type domain-containing protein n=1 Tax=Castilleja foliolosa TaxID=1961234 RepID=A0ABD3C4T1_9LAMI